AAADRTLPGGQRGRGRSGSDRAWQTSAGWDVRARFPAEPLPGTCGTVLSAAYLRGGECCKGFFSLSQRVIDFPALSTAATPGCHVVVSRRRYQSRVLCNPSSMPTRGCQPSSVRALAVLNRVGRPIRPTA